MERLLSGKAIALDDMTDIINKCIWVTIIFRGLWITDLLEIKGTKAYPFALTLYKERNTRW